MQGFKPIGAMCFQKLSAFEIEPFSNFHPYGKIATVSPLNGVVERTWGVKNRNVRPMYRFISDIIQDMAIVNVNANL